MPRYNTMPSGFNQKRNSILEDGGSFAAARIMVRPPEQCFTSKVELTWTSGTAFVQVEEQLLNRGQKTAYTPLPLRGRPCVFNITAWLPQCSICEHKDLLPSHISPCAVLEGTRSVEQGSVTLPCDVAVLVPCSGYESY